MLAGMKSLFHFAFNVTDLHEARRFYGGVLGCQEGRSTDTWVDFDFSATKSPCTWARLSQQRLRATWVSIWCPCRTSV